MINSVARSATSLVTALIPTAVTATAAAAAAAASAAAMAATSRVVVVVVVARHATPAVVMGTCLVSLPSIYLN